jgi:hypothetical protein
MPWKPPMPMSPVAACVPPLWAAAIYACALIGPGRDSGPPTLDSGSRVVAAGIAEQPTTEPGADTAPDAARPVIRRRRGGWCPECGVFESIRETIPGDLVDHGDAVSRRALKGSGATLADADRSGTAAATRYTVTLRFRDASAITTDEATQRAWKVGQRVIVVRSAAAPVP